MVLKIEHPKQKNIPDPIRETYNQLHILEFEQHSLMCKNPRKGISEDEDNPTTTDLKNLASTINDANTDIYASDYGTLGESLLIDFRGFEGRDIYDDIPDMPTAIAGAIAYAASFGFTAIALIDTDDYYGESIEYMFPGIMRFIEAAEKDKKGI